MRMLAAALSACIGLSMSSCATYNFPLEGTVTDSSTGKPLAGAFVVAKWIRYGSTPYGARTTCPGLEVVQADANGRYRIPEGKVYLSTEVVRNVFPYFPGYETDYAADRSDSRLVMKPYSGTVASRVESFRTYGSLRTCIHYQAQIEKLRPLYRAIDIELEDLSRRGPIALPLGTYMRSLEHMEEAIRIDSEVQAERRGKP